MTLPTFDNAQDLGQFINSIYIWSIGIVGLAVFIQFIRAGLTYLLAAGNASTTGKAKEMMQHAVLGAILLLSAYLILNVINPDLTQTNLFNLDEIAKQIKPAGSSSYSVPQTPTITSSVLPKEDAKHLFNSSGITIQGAKIDGISKYAVQDLVSIHQGCSSSCTMAITEFHAYQDSQWVTVAGDADMSKAIKNNYTKVNDTRYAGPNGTYYQNTSGNTWEIRYPVGTPF